MKVAIINSSPEVYNLAVHRIAKYHQMRSDTVIISRTGALFLPGIWNADKIYFSCIFTWDVPAMIKDINLLKQRDIEIEIGGPAATALPDLIENETGIIPKTGLDPRFEFTPGDDYEMTFTSRGCPRACDFCIVSKVEGRKMIEYDDFPIPVGQNPWVGDNNILATTWQHQEMVVEKLKHIRNLDLNSGFDDRIFVRDPDKYWQLYSQLRLERWRFAYDTPEQKEPLTACVNYLHSRGVRYSEISVFCLIGSDGDNFLEARERLQYLIDIETSPYPMRYRPLNSLKREYTPAGWDEHDLNVLFNYYGVPWFWRKYKWEDFRADYKIISKQQEERLL